MMIKDMTACQEADQAAALALQMPQIHCRLLAKLQPIHCSAVMVGTRNLCCSLAMTTTCFCKLLKCASSDHTFRARAHICGQE